MMKKIKKIVLFKGLRTATVMLLLTLMLMPAWVNVLAKSGEKSAFTNEQIFRGINFGEGPVASLFPEIWKNPDVVWQLQNDKKNFDKIRDLLLMQIKSDDPDFINRFGQDLQSGEHLRIQAALKESNRKLKEATQKINSGSYNIQLPSASLDDMGNSVVLDVDCGGVVVAFCMVVIWQYPGVMFIIGMPGTGEDLSQFSQENYINSIAERLSIDQSNTTE